ncbi:MAG TPA: tetratricopeptide repeat protein [Solirubrobacterales bacterium]|nr:tetratricopeptide repeat protein [Solirubrobacterales bacterium]
MSDVVPLLKFTPSAQDPAVLETITVQREPLIARLVDVALDEGGGARHQLLIGPRGIGKTHILSLVASRVRDEVDPGTVVLGWLEEDPWSITSYGKFLAAILARVAGERTDLDLAGRAATLHASGDRNGQEAEQALRDAVGESRLVLLVENLDEIFRRIGDNGQERFRAFAEDWQRMLIVATAPQLFEGVQLQESPFYGFFAITHLDELSVDSAMELMRRVAELRRDEELVAFLGTQVARRRIEAIEALAGGHPRIWLLLSGCVSIKAIDELVPLFLEALDDLTPYYQDRLRELGDQQQELVVVLGEAGGALSNRALSERTGIAQNQIATMLKGLSERGYVRRAEVPAELASGDARMSFWELREPLMRLCLDVKQARGKPLRMVVEFLRAWYGPRLLDELATLPSSARLAVAYVSEAFRTFDEELPHADLFRGSSGEIVARAELGLSLTPDRAELRFAKVTGLLMERLFAEAGAELAVAAADGDVSGRELRRLFAIQLQSVVDGYGAEDRAQSLLDGLLELRDSEPDVDLLGFIAVGLLLVGRPEEAVDLYPPALELDPEDIGLAAGYASALGRLDRDEEALAAYERAAVLDPGNALIQANVGVGLRRLGRDGEAVVALERALELDPDLWEVARDLGNALGSVGRHEEALAALDRGLATEPEAAILHSARTVTLRRLGREREALEAISRAVELDPENAEYWERMGSYSDLLGRFEAALAAHSRALELDPENARARVNRSGSLISLGRVDEALPEIEAVAELESVDPVVQRILGALLNNTGLYEAAVFSLRRALELDPDDSQALYGLGAALLNLGRYEESLEPFRRAAAADPDDPRKQAQFAVALECTGHSEQALEAFERARVMDPDDPDLYIGRAFAFESVGRAEEALLALRAGIERVPSDSRLRNHEANLLREQERFEEADEAIREAIALDERNAILRFTRSEISLSRGDGEAALRHLREALGLWDEAPAIRPGEPELICRILWGDAIDGPERPSVIAGIVTAYAGVEAGEALGRAVVASIAWMVDPDTDVKRSDAWAEAWLAAPAVDDLEIPMRLLRAAAAWKRDGDRAHLLELPAEQREILVGLLEGDDSAA